MKATLITALCVFSAFTPLAWATSTVSTPQHLEKKEPVAGIQLGQTRVVIEPGKHAAQFSINNHADRPFIISAFILDKNNQSSHAFAVDPSVFQLPARNKVSVRILQLENLPDDKESFFWLQVNSVVARSNENNNPDGALNLALGQKIKIFYRPKGLEGDARYAAENLQWHWQDGYLLAVNPTKFWISMSHININGQKHNISDMIQPLGNFKFKTPKLNGSEKDGFAFIDEYGGEVKLPFNIVK